MCVFNLKDFEFKENHWILYEKQDAGRTLFKEAISLWEERGEVFDVAQSYLLWAKLEKRINNLSIALSMAQQVRDTARSVNSSYLMDQAETLINISA